MHDRDDDDLLGIGSIKQRIRKPLKAASPDVLAHLRPKFGKVAEPLRSRYDFVKQGVAQAERPPVVTLDRLVEFLLGGRDKSRFHRFFRASIISSNVTEGISPRS